jgi:7-cyano-7-deazaguanine synthase
MIPGRNAMLLNIALMGLSVKDPSVVALGIHAGTSYRDCSQEFIQRMQSVFDLYSNGAVQIDTPFVGWAKNQIWELLVSHSYPVQHTYSCEAGDQPCGFCLSCKDVESLRAR